MKFNVGDKVTHTSWGSQKNTATVIRISEGIFTIKVNNDFNTLCGSKRHKGQVWDVLLEFHSGYFKVKSGKSHLPGWW